jgi:DNA-binding MarR family transcriptional regulator
VTPVQSERKTLQYLYPFQKIDIIYEYEHHHLTKKELADNLDLNYSTLVSAIKVYEENGRIFKLLPKHSKAFILKNRFANIGI